MAEKNPQPSENEAPEAKGAAQEKTEISKKEQGNLHEIAEWLHEAKDEDASLHERLSEKINQMVAERISQDRADGITEEGILERRAGQYEREANNVYYTERFGLRFLNKVGVKEHIRSTLVEALPDGEDGGVNTEKLQQHVRVAVDINGLKPVNDMAGHERGDEYLKRAGERLQNEISVAIGEVLGLPEGEVKKKILTSMEGGDEFGLYIDVGQEATPEIRKAIQDIIAAEMKKIDCSDILPAELINEKNMESGFEVSSEYKFTASAGAGVVSLLESISREKGVERILKSILEKKKKLAKEGREVTKTDIFNILMGEVLDFADEEMGEHKKEVKDKLDPSSKELLLRNSEMMLMKKEFTLMEGKLKEVEDQRDACLESRRVLGG